MSQYMLRPPEKPAPMTGDELRAWREGMGWGVQELATALDVSRAAVWRWENENREVPGPVRAAVALWTAALQSRNR